MTSSSSSNLALPYVQQAQAQKHVTVNEGLLRLDALVQMAVESRTLATEPASPSDGACYILPSGKTGAAWAAMAVNALAYYRDGAWEAITPKEGWRAFVRDTNQFVIFDGAAWNELKPGAQLDAANIWTAAQTLRTASPGGTPLVLECTDGGPDGPVLKLLHTSASPAANDFIGYIQFRGKDSAGNEEIFAYMTTKASVVTNGSEDAEYQFWTIRAGARAQRLAIGAGLVVGAPTGGDKGAGTINATAVYDDNVLLTCGPIEFLRHGEVDLDKWDALAPPRIIPAIVEPKITPDSTAGARASRVEHVEVTPARAEPRRHEAMHAFKKMLDEGFDPRDPANYCQRLLADGAPPGLITEAEWRAAEAQGERTDIGSALTRTFLAVDNLAVAFAGLVSQSADIRSRMDDLERKLENAK